MWSHAVPVRSGREGKSGLVNGHGEELLILHLGPYMYIFSTKLFYNQTTHTEPNPPEQTKPTRKSKEKKRKPRPQRPKSPPLLPCKRPDPSAFFPACRPPPRSTRRRTTTPHLQRYAAPPSQHHSLSLHPAGLHPPLHPPIRAAAGDEHDLASALTPA